jgi:SAM-dependent methyltransferase
VPSASPQGDAVAPQPLDRLAPLLAPGVVAVDRDGLVDTTGAALDAAPGPSGPSPARSLAQRAMRWRLLPLIYERAWRPLAFTAAAGGRTTAAEQRQIDRLLGLDGDGPPRRVLDVACGPGNTTRRLLPRLGDDALVVGLDAAPAMLRTAVTETTDPRAAYVLGDAGALPFVDGAFDAVTCLGALYLVEDAERVLEELARVLAPGGRLVVLTSCVRGPGPLPAIERLAAAPSGLRVFGRDEVTTRLAALGLTDVEQQVSGVLQLVGARRR